MQRRYRHHVGAVLAAAFLAGEWTEHGLASRGALALGESPAWLRAVAKRVVARFGRDAPLSRFEDLSTFVRDDDAVYEACKSGVNAPHVRRLVVPDIAMAPVEGARATWEIPSIPTERDLARWLELDVGHLEWFADRRGLERAAADPRLRHYVDTWVPKRTGGARLLEAPKARLKAIQRRILHEILDRVPPHESAHGFRRGRSIVSYATPHVKRDAVLHMDLEEFFLSIVSARVRALFESLGYPRPVARLLMGLCTNWAPATRDAIPLPPTPAVRDLALMRRAIQRHRTPHLRQGAPTSPALANLCAFGLDVRLDAAARSVGATYTRYADDLAFSGDVAFGRRAPRVAALVGGIALDEGLAVNHRKTKRMNQSARQLVCGLTVNVRPSPPRAEYDELKAILHNCATLGPTSQNREHVVDFRAHLLGRIAWVSTSSETRRAKLESLFRRIPRP
jgi:RNA-directed DNA polymerase